jgi:hypothetical protein
MLAKNYSYYEMLLSLLLISLDHIVLRNENTVHYKLRSLKKILHRLEILCSLFLCKIYILYMNAMSHLLIIHFVLLFEFLLIFRLLLAVMQLMIYVYLQVKFVLVFIIILFSISFIFSYLLIYYSLIFFMTFLIYLIFILTNLVILSLQYYPHP